MKKSLLITALSMLCLIGFPQPEQGKFTLSGSTNILGQKIKETYNFVGADNENIVSNFSFQTSAGVFVTDFIRTGLNYGYSYSKVTNSKEDYNKTKTTDFGPSIRVYFSDHKLIPFIVGYYGLSRLKTEQDEYQNSYNMLFKGRSFSAGMGAEYFLGQRFSFEFIVYYKNTKVIHTGDETDFMGFTSTYENKIRKKSLGYNLGINVFLN